MFNRFELRLFNSFSLFTVVLYFLAIEYRESPGFTVYVVSLEVPNGILNTSPIWRVLVVRLLALLIASTVTLYWPAILYKESPDLTVYSTVFDDGVSDDVVGSFKTWPTDKMFDVRLFNLFISSTVVLYFWAILYKESPLFTV